MRLVLAISFPALVPSVSRPDAAERLLGRGGKLDPKADWVGPGVFRDVPTNLLQKLKRPKAGVYSHLLLREGSAYVRLQGAEGSGHIGRGGMFWAYDGVLAHTSRSLKERLRAGACVHLCRELDCREEGPCALHVKAFAHLEPDAEVDLSAFMVPSVREYVAGTARGTCAPR